MRSNKQLFIAGALACAIVVTAIAGTESSSQVQDKFKMTTPIPPGIAIPNKVESRFGTLNFSDGVPDEATAQKLYHQSILTRRENDHGINTCSA